MIYFLQRANGDIKIGVTTQYYERIKVLKSEHGDLQLRGWLKGSLEDEKALHQRFANDRVDGEWFKSSVELLAYIGDYCNKDAPPKPQPFDEFTSIRVTRRTQHAINTICGLMDVDTGTEDLLIEMLNKCYPRMMEIITDLQLMVNDKEQSA